MLPDQPESTRRALARNILTRSLQVRRGENVLIDTWDATLDWANSAVLETRRLGAHPMLTVEDEATFWASAAKGGASTLGGAGSAFWAALREADAMVYFYGPVDFARERTLPKAVLDRVSSTDHEFFRVAEKFGVRCARWDFGRTSAPAAQAQGIDLDRWRSELIDGALADPRTLQRDGARVGRRLARGRTVHVTHPNGTDLELRLKGRRPKVDDGVIDEDDVREGNIFTVVPSGVVAVAVDESFAEGTFQSNFRSASVMDNNIAHEGGRWTFRGGGLVGYDYTRGLAEFRKAYTSVGKGRESPGALSIGLNPKISTIPLLEDQALGTVTLTIGRNAYLGGSNRIHRFTAYLVLRGADVTVDGVPLVTGGRLS
ncbi:MAG TPA: hypothetical protein VFF67_00545 [Thermoplasmata archaeon]|nr:hypothetical protein [Thermoplasmata archaeon]